MVAHEASSRFDCHSGFDLHGFDWTVLIAAIVVPIGPERYIRFAISWLERFPAKWKRFAASKTRPCKGIRSVSRFQRSGIRSITRSPLGPMRD
jgi:hypothetical protein